MSPILKFENISKSFYGVKALENVTIAQERGTVLGLVGENGAGKSTLMNILAGIFRADSGQMILNDDLFAPQSPMDAKRAGIAFIHQELNLYNNMSIADNIFINNFPTVSPFRLINKKRMLKRTGELLETVGLSTSPKTIVGGLSPGEKQLVEIAKAFSTGAEIFIFDEPTTSLTHRETDRLFELIQQLKNENATVIYISHILQDVKDLCDKIAVLRDGKLISSSPNEDYTIQKMISHMVGRKIDRLFPEKESQPTAEKVLSIDCLSQPGIVHNISFDLCRGEIVGFYGLMGSGRSELANILFGLQAVQNGSIRVFGKSRKRRTPQNSVSEKMAYLTENRRDDGLMMDASITENMALVSLKPMSQSGKLNHALVKNKVSGMATATNLKYESLDAQSVQTLSGGNQQKVVFGKWLLSAPAIFIVDEPTRGIDIGAKFEIYSLLNRLVIDGTSILLISSELEELFGMCDRILVMRHGEIRATFERSEFDEKKIVSAAFGELG